MKQWLLFLCIISCFTGEIQADSIWDYANPNVYSVSGRRIKVGDIVTVYVSESTTAVQEASTRTSKKSNIGTNMLSAWDQVANLLGNENIRKQSNTQLSGEDGYRGAGQTSRRSQIKTVITAIITEVLESGNLYIVGEHKIKINQEVETIRIAGVIRPQDIQGNNSINSFQIAKAEISVNGSGVVSEKQTPGMLTKVFNWVF